MLKANWIFKAFYLAIILQLSFNATLAQPALPQRTNTIRAIQPLHFGSFCITGAGGGTITIGIDGSRSATGNIILLDLPPFAQPAIFELKFCPSNNVCLNFETPIVMLNGSQGSIPLEIGPTDKGPDGACFSINTNCDAITPIRVGGILTVMGSTFPGSYTGRFSISFTRQ